MENSSLEQGQRHWVEARGVTKRKNGNKGKKEKVSKLLKCYHQG